MGKSRSKRKSKDKLSEENISQPQQLRSTTMTASLSLTNGDNNNSVHLPQAMPQHLPRPCGDNFLKDESPYRKSFRKALTTSYEGFVFDDAATLMSQPTAINNVKEDVVQNSLESMSRDGIFRTDVTQPFGLGTKCAKTYVTRCLVGSPGTTYKYLGLRMFAHPWTTSTTTDEDNNNNSNMKRNDNERRVCNTVVTNDAQTIQELALALTNRTKKHLRDLDESRRQRQPMFGTRGRPGFDICLINRMESSSDLKPYNFSGDSSTSSNGKSGNKNGVKTTVSWHADSSLEHFSSIAVYQTILGSQKDGSNNNSNDKRKRQRTDCQKQKADEEEEGQWLVALRVAHHSEGPQASQQRRRGTNTETATVEETPPIAVNLPSGSCYYLLDDFNHHHQHTVLTTGNTSTVRYSCTFRLLRDSHNIQDWIDRGKSAMRQFHKKGSRIWRSEQLLLTEIESEWIRQFYIQGTGHHQLLWESYWKDPIQELLSIWSRLEHRTEQTIELLRAAAEGKCGVGMNTEKAADKPTKAERKARDRRKKSLASIRELVSRINETPEEDGATAFTELYQPMAELLEERAEMRSKWEKREKDHVFHELPLDYRPMKVPFKFERTIDENNIGNEYVATSPLPNSPDKLKEIAAQLLQLGRAYRNGDAKQLPPPWKKEKPKQNALAEGDSTVDDHSKPLDWSGWNACDQLFGLELQHPWAAAIIDGKKVIETRSYSLPPSLIGGTKIMIIESSSGKAGVSSLCNHVDFSTSSRKKGTGNSKVIGWCTFTSVKTYTTKQEFQAEENLHLVTPDSGYGWKDDGSTEKVYGWIVGERYRFDESSTTDEENFLYDSGVRRFRSLFQLHKKKSKDACPNTSNKKNINKRNLERKNKQNSNGKKKKRGRY